MILWTIQGCAVAEQLKQNQRWVADENLLFTGAYFLWSYDWISRQLATRREPAPAGVKYPVWAWYQWEGQRKRPDMRTRFRRYRDSGTPLCLLTLDVPDEHVLLSDFDMWHCVMNGAPVAIDEADEERRWTWEETVASWERIFEWELVSPYWDEPKSTQAIFWEIRPEWVKKMEFFTAY